tara:strand:- start:2249 stop:2971 length:723 start_codon:yes stop_codon:yes gene_type:complete
MNNKKKYLKYKLKYLTTKKKIGGSNQMLPPPSDWRPKIKNIKDINNYLLEIIYDLIENKKIDINEYIEIYKLNNLDDLDEFLEFYLTQYFPEQQFILNHIKELAKIVLMYNNNSISVKKLTELVIPQIKIYVDNINKTLSSQGRNKYNIDLKYSNFYNQIIDYKLNHNFREIHALIESFLKNIYEQQFISDTLPIGELHSINKCIICNNKLIYSVYNDTQFLFQTNCPECNTINYDINYD